MRSSQRYGGWAIAAAAWAALLARSAPAQEVIPMPKWSQIAPAGADMDSAKLDAARKVALTAGGSGCIVRGGRLVMSWGSQTRRYDLKSTTKSIGFTAVGLALADGKIKSLTDRAGRYHPEMLKAKGARAEWLEKITLRHLATHTAGFAKPGGSSRLLFEPGTKWHYSDSGPNWLAECVALAYKRDVRDLLFERVFTPLGITAKDLTWRQNWYRPPKIQGLARREFGAGVSANVNAMARIGLLYLRAGRWGRKQLLPKAFVASVARTPAGLRGLPVAGKIGAKPPATGHYGLLWWTNADGAMRGVPRDAYWSWGLHDSHIVVIPSLNVVVARAGKSWPRGGRTDYAVLGDFLRPIVAACGWKPSSASRPAATASAASRRAPYPASRAITGISWAPKSEIIRKARGSDNWPITWGDDDAMYTAYGDGWGFMPKVRGKLSLGLAKVTGPPEAFKGVNIRSATAEQKGDGPRGRKACGMLMARGVLYMWVRNADGAGKQSQLAWSADRGRTWTWSRWKFAELGYPCLLNFGRNYTGARDDYVYLYSPDTPSAYQAADRVVLARVQIGKISDRAAYEFFVRHDANGRCVWTKAIKRRGTVFAFKGGCNRLSVTYNAPLKRYLMTMRSRRGGREGARSVNHFGIYDAPEPWGPWTTVFCTEAWDVDPGEAQHIPSRWIGPNGKTFHLVFSGDDSFSVRRATLKVAKP